MHLPTLTAVLPSSSEYLLLGPCLLLMLILLELLLGRTSMLMGRCTAPPAPLGTGEPGGLAMVAAPRVVGGP
jgi:hypothetical protein